MRIEPFGALSLFSSDSTGTSDCCPRVRVFLLLTGLTYEVYFLYCFMDNSTLTLLTFDGFVYSVKKDERNDFMEDYSSPLE